MISEDRMAGDRLDLDAIEARLKAATPGPWYWTCDDGRPPLRDGAARNLIAGLHGVRGGVLGCDHRGPSIANATLICHAPEDIAALIAALRARAVPDPREAAPSPWAYEQVCAANERKRRRIAELEAAIEKFTAPMDKTTSVEYGPGWYELRATARDGGAPHVPSAKEIRDADRAADAEAAADDATWD